jgi:hypothetical protein
VVPFPTGFKSLFSKMPMPGVGITQHPVFWGVLGLFFPGVNLPKRKTDQSLPSGVKITNYWRSDSTVLYVFAENAGE